MPSAQTIKTSCRLPNDLHLELSAFAAARGVPLSQLMVERLEAASPLNPPANSLTAAQAARPTELLPPGYVRGLDASLPLRAGGDLPACVLLEILLLLRQVSGPQKLSAVHGELERQGYGVWVGGAL